MPNSPFKVSGPEVAYEIGAVRCCRIWPIVTATLTVTTEGWQREQWWYRNCGICGEFPRPVEDDRDRGRWH